MGYIFTGMYIIFSIILPLVKCNLNLPSIGRCPNLQGVQNLNAALFSGAWTVTKRSFFYADFDCETIVFVLDDGNNFRCFKIFSNSLTEFSRTFTAQTINQGQGRFAYLRSFAGDNVYMRGQFTILATNYASYAIIYQCSDFLTLRYSSVIVLIRGTTPPPNLDLIVNQVLLNNNITIILVGTGLENNCIST